MMKELYESLQLLGLGSLDAFWFPVGIWTMVALFVFALLRFMKFLNPLYQYHLRVATLAAIPLGLISTFIVQKLAAYFQSPSFDGAIFVVETPQQFYITPYTQAEVFNPNWLEPNFLIGAATAFALLISLVMIIRLVVSYVTLKRLHNSLCKSSLDQNNKELNAYGLDGIKLAYHDHPLVPFTFGYRNPIIVLPNAIKDDPEKIRMAIQHELVHIKRGDYLLQLFISAIDSVFWFHPLIKQGTREIETWREISCDQEVLNVSGISLKSYASMLYELVPLNRGLGSFSVSMAVQNSTLKKRIQTMKYHKLHKSSLKRSLLFLFVMIVGVTLPIACSDMRGPQGLDESELETLNLSIVNPQLEINGVELQKISKTLNGTGLDGFLLGANDYGSFIISPIQFDGAIQNGLIKDNAITFTVNELKVRVTTDQEITGNSIPIWVNHISGEQPGILTGTLPNRILHSTDLDKFIAAPPTPTSEESPFTGDYFVVVEKMPELIGGLYGLQSKVVYPEMARRAGIEGRVTVQFIVNENGDVEEPRIIRGIGGGADEAALAAVSQAKFEPGKQRGRAVRVQYALPIIFKLADAEYSGSFQGKAEDLNTEELSEDGTLYMAKERIIKVEPIQQNNGTLKVKVTDVDGNPLVGAYVVSEELRVGSVTNQEGIATIPNIEAGNHDFKITYIGFGPSKLSVIIQE